ncbi:hypothetical protein [Bacillus pumilus]|uniref:hypothetical protein n=1 Tax=Bacillus pumilus TaxID=1408 RepID=UPI0034D9706D
MEQLIHPYKQININHTPSSTNQPPPFTPHLHNILHLPTLITIPPYNTNQTPPPHYKPHFPHTNHQQFLKTTIPTFKPKNQNPPFHYHHLHLSLIPPPKPHYSNKNLQK